MAALMAGLVSNSITHGNNVNGQVYESITRTFRASNPVMRSNVAHDGPIFSGTKNISGTVYAVSGLAVPGATVKLFRQMDDLLCQTQTSDGSGHYFFVRDASDTYAYYVLAYTPGATPQVHGVSDRDGVPV